jgi:hypothetical protein
MRKVYQSKDLEDIGLKASLRTELIDGSVQYVFAARPLSDKARDRFDEVIRKRRDVINFFLDLEDDGGFELCHTSVSWYPNLGQQGKIVAIHGKGIFSDCPGSRYSRSNRWDIAFNFPSVSENLSPPAAIPVIDDGDVELTPNNSQSKCSQHDFSKSTDSTNQANTPVITEDKLTGADLSGGIETLSGKSFRVTSEAEKLTLLEWRPSDSLALSCTQRSCLITDKSRSQSVHAQLVK